MVDGVIAGYQAGGFRRQEDTVCAGEYKGKAEWWVTRGSEVLRVRAQSPQAAIKAALEHICMNPLYGCGFHRVGCIGCPIASKMRKVEFARWPKYRDLYIHAFDRMLEERRRRGLQQEWQTGLDVFHWWMEDGVLPGQMVLEEMEGEVL